MTFSDLEGQLGCLKPLYPSAALVHVHDGALAEKYTLSSTTLVVVDVNSAVDMNKIGYMEIY